MNDLDRDRTSAQRSWYVSVLLGLCGALLCVGAVDLASRWWWKQHIHKLNAWARVLSSSAPRTPLLLIYSPTRMYPVAGLTCFEFRPPKTMWLTYLIGTDERETVRLYLLRRSDGSLALLGK